MSSTVALTYRSNGKLMFTGEYLVLKGALSLSVPLRFGQDIRIVMTDVPGIHWETFVENEDWFTVDFALPGLGILSANDEEKAVTLRNLLMCAHDLNPAFLDVSKGYKVSTSIDFPVEWGVGSSSSLVSNVAYWANCDPFELNRRVFHGSGYDIACARSYKPVLYRLDEGQPKVQKVDFYPPFSSKLFFVWLNKKQNTREGISVFDQQRKYSQEIAVIDSITNALLSCREISSFQKLIAEHEQVVASVLGVDPIKRRLFPDFPGSVKSLGAWGGDFALAVSVLSATEVKTYFKQKGFSTVLSYNEMVWL